jgi:hypothetical protein
LIPTAVVAALMAVPSPALRRGLGSGHGTGSGSPWGDTLKHRVRISVLKL